MPRLVRLVIFGLFAVAGGESLLAVPVNRGGGDTISDRKNFIPNRKHLPIPGKIVGVLVYDAQPVLSTEGRSGPADQLCLGYNGGSYRWVYVPVDKNPMIQRIDLPVGQNGEKKRFNSLSLANPATVKQFGIETKYALVEIEVNDGLGSPPNDSLVATKMKRLDGTKEFPLDVEAVVADAKNRFQDYQREHGREIDAAIEKAAAAAIKERKATGPRERSELMYLTWMPETQRLRIHFRTTVTDGDYKYEGGINIDTGGRGATQATAPLGRPGNVSVNRFPQGLRYGTQFGIEFGVAYEISKSGKVERSLMLPIEAFQREVRQPNIIPRQDGMRGGTRAMAPAAVPTAKK